SRSTRAPASIWQERGSDSRIATVILSERRRARAKDLMTDQDWRPGATLETLKARAELLGSVRAFFSARGVMEVDTPVLSRHATVDRHIDSFRTTRGDWLHTSPEFAMK